MQVSPCTKRKNTEVQGPQEGLAVSCRAGQGHTTPKGIGIQAQGGLCYSPVSLLWWCHSCRRQQEARSVSGAKSLLRKCPYTPAQLSLLPPLQNLHMCSDCNQYSSSASGEVWEILKPLQRKGKWVWGELTWWLCDDCPLIQPLWAPASHARISCFLYAYLCATSQSPSARAAATLICFPPLQLCCWKRWMEHLMWHYILFWGIVPCGKGDGDGLHFWFCSVQLIFMPREEFLLKIFLLLLQFYFWFRGDDFIEWKDLLSLCIQTAIFSIRSVGNSLVSASTCKIDSAFEFGT